MPDYLAAGGVTKLSELTIDQTGRLIPAVPLSIASGVTRVIPSGHHTEIITAHNNQFTVDGVLQVDGTFLFMDLGT